MLDDFFLSDSLKNILSEFFSENKILFIYGEPGIGKTTLAREIFKDRIITEINCLNLKEKCDMNEYLQNIVEKNNITLMFSCKRKQRGIIIDDLDTFYKLDKKSFKVLIHFLERKEFYNAKVICILNTKLITNKSFKKINMIKFPLFYTKDVYYKLFDIICKKKNKELLTFDTKLKLLTKYNYNFNSIFSNLEHQQTDKKSLLDNFDSSDILYKKLFKTNYKTQDLLRFYDSDRITISLNLLENLIDYTCDIKVISDIYRSYIYGDIYETKMINESHNDMYTFCTIYKLYKSLQNKNKIITDYKNNKYLSQCFIYIHSSKLQANFMNSQFYTYLCIYILHKKDKKNKYCLDYLKHTNKSELEFYLKSYNYFYKSNIKKIIS